MLEALLKQILKPEHRAAGMELSEEDDHCVHLFQHGKRIATFSATSATIEKIWEEADKHLRLAERASKEQNRVRRNSGRHFRR